jgi:hypothetical protein
VWRDSRALFAAALVVGLAAAWGWGAHGGDRVAGRLPRAAAQTENPLPLDPDQQLVTGRCVICHSLEMIAQQRQTRDEWTVILDRMISYGMPMGPGDRERILAYLARYLGQ